MDTRSVEREEINKYPARSLGVGAGAWAPGPPLCTVAVEGGSPSQPRHPVCRMMGPYSGYQGSSKGCGMPKVSPSS